MEAACGGFEALDAKIGELAPENHFRFSTESLLNLLVLAQ